MQVPSACTLPKQELVAKEHLQSGDCEKLSGSSKVRHEVTSFFVLWHLDYRIIQSLPVVSVALAGKRVSDLCMGRARRGGGDAGGGKNSAKDAVEFTRIVPRFLQELKATPSEGRESTHINDGPSTVEKGDSGASSVEEENADRELDDLRRAGFNVDVVAVSKALLGDSGLPCGASTKPAPKSKATKAIAGVATSRIRKTRVCRSLPKHNAFGSQNKAILSFAEGTDEEDSSDDGKEMGKSQ